MLSDMLWAAFGINRPAEGKRTAPTAMNRQDIDVYVLDAAGVWRYEAKENALIPVLEKDLRSVMASQPFAAKAPVTLLYVAENPRWIAAVPPLRFLTQSTNFFQTALLKTLSAESRFHRHNQHH